MNQLFFDSGKETFCRRIIPAITFTTHADIEAQVFTAQTKRDELVAAYSLLSATGQLNLATLGLRAQP